MFRKVTPLFFAWCLCVLPTFFIWKQLPSPLTEIAEPLKDDLKTTNSQIDSVQNFELIQQRNKRPDGYDVIDIGSSKGSGSINFLNDALNLLGDAHKKAILDPRTLGLDNDPKKVETCSAAQKGTTNHCKLADILTLTPESLNAISKRTISGNTYWHVLEHIPDCAFAEKMWIKAAALSKSFSSFHGPAFDNELSASGKTPTNFHRFWENWSGHQCHFNSTMLEHAITTTTKTTAYIIVNYGRIESTDYNIIVPKETAQNSHHYDSNIHLRKESQLLDVVLYEEMRGCAIYDDIHKQRLSLFSALCLYDALHGPRRTTGLEVQSCSFGKTNSIEECTQLLSVKVMDTIMHFYKTDLNNIIKIA